jgi:hypothetical protein
VYEDLNEMVAAFKKSVSEGGDLAEYLEQQSESFDDPIAVDYEKFGTAQRIEEVASNLKSWGIAPASFSNITYTRLGAIVRKMESSRIVLGGQKTKFFKKMAIPAGNAFLGAITTYEACTLMGGVNFRHHDGTETFFDPRFGLIMPASRFLTTYELHGGWDLDDTVGLFLIKVYCTDQERLAELVESGVLDPAINVPGEKSEAVEVGLMIRRPNGPGEYSIERVDPDMPWMHYNAERVEVVDLAGAPDGIDAVYSRTNIVPFERMMEIPVAYTRGVAHEAVQAQIINPGVGGFANLLIAWTKTFGVGNLPDTMIGKMEDIVDAVQQSADVLAFSAIAYEVRRLWEEFAQKVIETSTPVDSAVWMTRIPKSLGFRPQVKIGLAIHEAGLVEPGDWTRIQNRYNKAIDFCRKLSMDTANITRNNLPLAQRIKAEEFGPAYKNAAAETVKNTAIAFKKLDAEFRALDASAGDNVIMRRAFQTQRRLATEKLVDKMTQNIMELESLDTNRFVLALYKYMTTPRKGWPNGDIDRLFVQPCSEGGVCLMELFLKSLEDSKILEDIQS